MRNLWLVPFLVAPLWAGTKEEIIRLQSDVLALQNQIRLLQKSFDGSAALNKSLLEQLNDQAAKTGLALQEVSKDITDSQASFKHDIQQLVSELRTLALKMDDTNARIGALSVQMAEKQVKEDQLRTQVPLVPGGSPAPDQIYYNAYSDFLQGHYDLAIQGFRDYLQSYKETELADNAQYYIGESHYSTAKFNEALLAYDQVIHLYPQGDKVAPSYLKKGLALIELQHNEDAIVQLQAVVKNFPTSPEANTARQKLEEMGVKAKS
ncbi:MAG: tol-pal system protein YbgF [Acidobacteria bacterium]|nr:tol-pal system protein YbgF [Acidobacteriota bacterium]